MERLELSDVQLLFVGGASPHAGFVHAAIGSFKLNVDLDMARRLGKQIYERGDLVADVTREFGPKSKIAGGVVLDFVAVDDTPSSVPEPK